ncbi:hypothetical protein AAE478_006179 [Parahypoxylon ruwenzoriense]
MTNDGAVQWDPVTDAEKAVKEAFSKLNDSNDKVVVPGSQGKPNRFVLHTKGYYDLRAYVLTGKDFPKSTTEFQTKMPKTAFQKLTEIDSDIYDKTRDVMVSVGSTCSDYHQNHLAKLVTAASAAANYSDNTVSLLEEAEDINLKHQLNVLLDPKYKTEADQDQAFKDAREGAQMTLSMLKDDALNKEGETKEILQSLITFKENTMKHLNDVKFLIKQYKTGPVTNASNMKKPYLQYLNEKLQADIDNFNRTVKEANDKYNAWEEATGIAVGLAFTGIIGWIVMGVKAAEASNLRKAYDNLMEQVRKLTQDRQEEATLITFVTQLVNAYTDIDGKMSAAIDAIAELAGLFNEQAGCYDKIAVSLGGMWTGTTSDSAVNRKAYINYNMKKAIEKLKELKELADEFAKTIINEVKLQ